MKVAYDTELMRPACVLVAAGLGADSNVANRFSTKLWLLTPTPDMKVYDTNATQLEQLIKVTELYHADPSRQQA